MDSEIDFALQFRTDASDVGRRECNLGRQEYDLGQQELDEEAYRVRQGIRAFKAAMTAYCQSTGKDREQRRGALADATSELVWCRQQGPVVPVGDMKRFCEESGAIADTKVIRPKTTHEIKADWEQYGKSAGWCLSSTPVMLTNDRDEDVCNALELALYAATALYSPWSEGGRFPSRDDAEEYYNLFVTSVKLLVNTSCCAEWEHLECWRFVESFAAALQKMYRDKVPWFTFWGQLVKYLSNGMPDLDDLRAEARANLARIRGDMLVARVPTLTRSKRNEAELESGQCFPADPTVCPCHSAMPGRLSV